MPTVLGIVTQNGTATFRILKGKDLDITQGASTLGTLENADIFLVDEAAAGTQASTKKITASTMKTYFQTGVLTGTIGIADSNILSVDHASAADNDFAKFTSSGLEGRSYSEVKSDLNLDIGTDVLAQQTIGIANNNLVEIDHASVADDDYARFTANGLEGRSASEVLSDIGAGTSSVANLNDLGDVSYSSGDLTITSLDKIVSGALTFDNSGDITFDMESNIMYIKNNGSDNPMLAIHQISDSPVGPILDISNTKGGAAGDDNDLCGVINFNGMDDAGTPAESPVASIAAQIDDVTAGSERGHLTLKTSTYNGSVYQGLEIKGTTTEDTVDVEIGYGAASVTTIVGNLNLGVAPMYDGQLNCGSIDVGPLVSINKSAAGTGATLDARIMFINSSDETYTGDYLWALGFDASDSNKLKINSSTTGVLVDSSTFEISSDGAISLNNAGTNIASISNAGATVFKGQTMTLGNNNEVTVATVDDDHLNIRTGNYSAGSAGTQLQLHKDGACALTGHADLALIVAGNIGCDGWVDAIYSQEVIGTTGVENAVNNIAITNAVTTGTPKINAIGSDTNIDLELAAKGTGAVKVDVSTAPLKLAYDASNYVSLGVANDGHLTLTGTGTDDDLTVDIDGDIVLDSLNDVFKFQDNGTVRFEYAVTSFNIYGESGSNLELFSIIVNPNGVTTLGTSDAGGTAGHLTLYPDGDLIFNPASGNYIAKNNNTEFSAANSAYAGMILGYTRLQGDLVNYNSYEIQDALTVEDSTHQITFITPPSENVEIECSCFLSPTSTDTEINVGLSDSSSYSAVSDELEYDVQGVFFTDDEADKDMVTFKFVLSASHLAAAGSSNTFYIGFGTGGVSKIAYLFYGRRSSHSASYPPFVIKATALPATIYDGQ